MARELGPSTPVSDSVTHALKEYMWWCAVRSVQTHFEGRFADGSRVPTYAASFERTISKSEARGRLHDEMERRAAELAASHSREGGVPTIYDYAYAMRQTIADRVSFLSPSGERVPYQATFGDAAHGEAAERDFALHHTGSARDVLVRFSEMLSAGVLAMSPFDPALASFEAAAAAGVDVCGLRLRGDREGASGSSVAEAVSGLFVRSGDGTVTVNLDWFGPAGAEAVFREMPKSATVSPFTGIDSLGEADADALDFRPRRVSRGLTRKRGGHVENSPSGAVYVESLDEEHILWGSMVDRASLALLAPSVFSDDAPQTMDAVASSLFGRIAEEAGKLAREGVGAEALSQALDRMVGECREQVEGASDLAQGCLSRGWPVTFAASGNGAVDIEVHVDDEALGGPVSVRAIDLAEPGRVGAVRHQGTYVSRFLEQGYAVGADGEQSRVRGGTAQPIGDGEVIFTGADGESAPYEGGSRALLSMVALENLLGEPSLSLRETADGLTVGSDADGEPARHVAPSSIDKCRLVKVERGSRAYWEVRPSSYFQRNGSIGLVDSASYVDIATGGGFDLGKGGSVPAGLSGARLSHHPVPRGSAPTLDERLMGKGPEVGASRTDANPEVLVFGLWEDAMRNYNQTMAGAALDGQARVERSVYDGVDEEGNPILDHVEYAIGADADASEVLAPLYRVAERIREAREAFSEAGVAAGESSVEDASGRVWASTDLSADTVELPVSPLEATQRAYLHLLLGESESLGMPSGRLVAVDEDGNPLPSEFDGVVVEGEGGMELWRGDGGAAEATFDVSPDDREWVSVEAMAKARGLDDDGARRVVCEAHFRALRSVTLGSCVRDTDGRVVADCVALAQGEVDTQGGMATHARSKSINPVGISTWGVVRGASGSMSSRSQLQRALSLMMGAGRFRASDVLGTDDDGRATDDAVGRLMDETRHFEAEGAKTLPEMIREAREGAVDHFLAHRGGSRKERIARADAALMVDLERAYGELALPWPVGAADPEDVWRASQGDFARAVSVLEPHFAGSVRTPRAIRQLYVARQGVETAWDEEAAIDARLVEVLSAELAKDGAIAPEGASSAVLWASLVDERGMDAPEGASDEERERAQGAIDELFGRLWGEARLEVREARAEELARAAGIADPIGQDPTVAFWAKVRDSLESTFNAQGIVVDVDRDVLVDATGNLEWRGWAFKSATVKHRGAGRFSSPEAAVAEAASVFSEIGRSDTVASDNRLGIRHARGLVGPLFAPDHDGVVRTANLASPDWSSAVGWRASVDMSEEAIPDPFAEKLFLEDYTIRMCRALSVQVGADCASVGEGTTRFWRSVGDCSSLVGAFRRMTSGHRHDGLEWGGRESEVPQVFDSAKVLMAQGSNGPVLSFDERVGARRAAMAASEPTYEAMAARAEASRVSFDTAVREQASPVRSVDRSLGAEPSGDSTYLDYWSVFGERSIWTKTDQAFDGIFDHAGPMTSVAQGSVAFLVKGAKVDADGYVIPATPDDGVDAMRSYLLSDEAGILVNSRADPADRQNMALRSLLDARGVDAGVGVACVSLGGYTMDGGIVIASEMAEACRVADATRPGETRALRPGDKLSDLHGNKGVVSFVVPTRDEVESGEVVLTGMQRKIAELFWANEGRLLYAAEPYAWSGRLSPGSYFDARDGATGHTAAELRLERPGNDNGPLEFGISVQPIVVAVQTADSKTKRYEDVPGQGRRASAQLAQALATRGASEVAGALWGKNAAFMDTLDERLRILGYQATPDGCLTTLADRAPVSREERERLSALSLLGERAGMRERRVFWVGAADAADSAGFGAMMRGRDLRRMSTEEVRAFDSARGGRPGTEVVRSMLERPSDQSSPSPQTLHTWRVGEASLSREGVVADISRSGGVLALPFPIRLASGDETPRIRRANAVDGRHGDWEAEPPVDRPAFWDGVDVWGLPVSPVSMRFESSGLEGSIPHDDTRLYIRLAELAAAWHATWAPGVDGMAGIGGGAGGERIDFAKGGEAARAEARERIEQAAQEAYEREAPRLERLAATCVRRSGVSVPQGRSAHAVIIPNPEIGLAEVAIPESLCRHLGVGEGRFVMDFRDPVLHPGGVSFSDVEVVGDGKRSPKDAIGKNPAWDRQADADFDGDMEGVFAISLEAAIDEGRREMTPAARLLNFVQPPAADGTKGAFANMGLDVASGMAIDAELAKAEGRPVEDTIAGRYEEWKRAAARHFAGREPWARAAVSAAERDGDMALMAELEGIVAASYDVRGRFAEDAVAFSPDAYHYLRSLYVTGVEHAGKGSLSKLAVFAERGGFGWDSKGLSEVELVAIESGERVPIAWLGGVEADPEDLAASEFATATKSVFTGRAGKFLQELVTSASWHSPEASWCVGAMTALVTQALLQAKHDADQALTLASAVSDAMNHLWSGHRIRIVRDEDGFFDRVEAVPLPYAASHVFSEKGGAFAHATPEEWVQQAVELYDALGTPLDPAIAKAFVEFDSKGVANRGLAWAEIPDGFTWKGRRGLEGPSSVTWVDPVDGSERCYRSGSRYMAGVKTEAICDGRVAVLESAMARLGFEKKSFDAMRDAAEEGTDLFCVGDARDNFAAMVEPEGVALTRAAGERLTLLEGGLSELRAEAAEGAENLAERQAVARAVEVAAETLAPRVPEAMRAQGRGVPSRAARASREVEGAPEVELADEDRACAVGE